jgi:hypothetical protein
MEEKEVIRRIRNSLDTGLSEAHIIGKLQKEGYKLEYIEALIKKSRRKKLFYSFIIVSFLFIITFILLISLFSYLFFIKSPAFENKANLSNPIAGFNINFDEKNLSNNQDIQNNQENESIYLDDIEITPEFITYLLNEFGFWKLKSNPLTKEKPLINFVIGEETFNSIVSKNKITTNYGLGNNPDLILSSNKEDIVHALLSEDPALIFKESFKNGKTSLSLEKSEKELFLKGYLPLYDSLKN